MTAVERNTTPVTWPDHDPPTWRNVPASSAPIDQERVAVLLAAEWKRFEEQTPGSAAHHARALQSLPLGVHVLVPVLGPAPGRHHLGQGRLAHRRRRPPGARPVDGLRRDARRPPQPDGGRRRRRKALETGTLFVTPSPAATDAAERFQRRFSLDQLRFANSGTEATMYALRTARAFTNRKAIIKIEGGYHGGYDALQVSVKPDLSPKPVRRHAPTPRDAVRRRGRHGLRRPLQRPPAARAGPRRARRRGRVCLHGAGAGEHRHRRPGRRLPRRRPRAVRPARRRC